MIWTELTRKRRHPDISGASKAHLLVGLHAGLPNDLVLPLAAPRPASHPVMLPRALSRQQSGLAASTSGRDVAAACPTVQRAWWSWLASQGRSSSTTTSSSRHAAPLPAAAKGRSAAAFQFNPVKLDLPAAEFTRIRTAEYISSSVDLRGCPPQRYPEFAVIGRSNVGKSSLINMLTQQQGLAKVSKEPGGRLVCTRPCGSRQTHLICQEWCLLVGVGCTTSAVFV
jgi:hypothetical protein